MCNVLSEADIETFTKTNKIFKNVNLWFCETETELLLSQLATISSIKLCNVFLDWFYTDKFWRMLKKYEYDIRTLTITVKGNETEVVRRAHEMIPQFPKAKIILNPEFRESPLLMDMENCER